MILISFQPQLKGSDISHLQFAGQFQGLLDAGLGIREVSQFRSSHPHGIKDHGLRMAGQVVGLGRQQ